MTYTSVVTTRAVYKLIGNEVLYNLYCAGTTGGTASNTISATTPFTTQLYGTQSATKLYWDGAGNWLIGLFDCGGGKINVEKSDSSNFALATDVRMAVNNYFEI
jgi:hypothetical protein